MRILLLIFSELIFISCTENKIPKEVLPKPKMEQLMLDLMVADEWATYRHTHDTSFTYFDSSKIWYQQIFKKHKTDEASFKRSLHFYEDHPDLFQEITDLMQKHSQAGKLLPAKLPVKIAY